ncbi:MAG TPA: hypothetical protein VMV94_06050 [Phycisphaerae bacterium]|nr:hypothetical protein [Phycisphaerae bacterium]
MIGWTLFDAIAEPKPGRAPAPAIVAPAVEAEHAAATRINERLWPAESEKEHTHIVFSGGSQTSR